MTNGADLKRASAKTRWPAIILILISMAALALASSALSSSPPAEPPPPTEIRLSAEDHGRAVQLREGEELVISLEANPSTGYAWQVDRGPLAAQSQSILVQTGAAFETAAAQGSTDVEPSTTAPPVLGAPEIQTLRFQAAQAGQTRLRLVYRRPWEADAPPAHEFSLSVEAVGPFTQPPPTPMVSAPQPTSPLSVDLGEAGPLGLPSAFNWCDQGACTPVRNQGGCGSCWAFSTVGPLESNMLIHGSLEKDLSEQYLLSCNTDGWNCRGGFFAHDYHEWKIPPGELDTGAVYEADFPYTAYSGQVESCNAPHTHHEKIVDWEYVGGPGGVPPVANIKQAILDHGPVSVAICIGSAFQSYPGGVFQINETCPDIVNHAVVLVGWDDSEGVWHLRNSWGPYWGESGYMRIGYGISSVGYAANYVIYDPTCYDLDTKVYPVGAGTVVADPPPDCEGGYAPTTVVKLTASDNAGWHFFAWGGDASGPENPIAITTDSPKSVAALFMCDGCTPRAHFPLVMKD
ncbi:MAG TPA: C1 family peptidase [Anaerolineae bacterium]|nr:C1 family peptidase [Anaerolineae bacterium]